MIGALRKAFAHWELRDIDEAIVREWMTKRATMVKPATVNRELDALKAMLRAAIPKYLTTHPLSNVRRFRVPEVEPRVLTVSKRFSSAGQKRET